MQAPTTPNAKTRSRTGPAIRSGLVAIATLAATAAPALAQQSSALKPPAPREDPSAPVVMTMLTLVVLVVATLFVAVFPSKRGHQD